MFSSLQARANRAPFWLASWMSSTASARSDGLIIRPLGPQIAWAFFLKSNKAAASANAFSFLIKSFLSSLLVSSLPLILDSTASFD